MSVQTQIRELQDVCIHNVEKFSDAAASLLKETDIDVKKIRDARDMATYYKGGWNFLEQLKMNIECETEVF